MDISAFQDYSNVLQPLPRVGIGNGAEATPAGSSEEAGFRDTLRLASLRAASAKRSGVTQKPLRANQSNPGGTPLKQNSAGEDKSAELMKACRDLEGFFLNVLLRGMSTKLSEEGIFGASFESSIYQDMFYSELSKSVAEKGRSLGIADMIFNDIIMKSPKAV